MKRMILFTLGVIVTIASVAEDFVISSFGSGGLITWTNAPEYSNRTYRVEWSDDLTGGGWHASTSIITNFHYSIEGMSLFDRLFYRINMNSQTIHVATDGSDVTGSGTASAPYATIQHAINMAGNGSVVLVEPGVYSGNGNGNLTIHNKNISVISVEGPLFTTIDGTGFSHILDFSGQITNAWFSGFTIRNAHLVEGADWGKGGVVRIGENASPIIDRCIFKHNTITSSYHTTQPGLILFIGTTHNASLQNSLVVSNSVSGGTHYLYGYAALARTSEDNGFSNASIVNCTFADNSLSATLRRPIVKFNGTVMNTIDKNNSATLRGARRYAVYISVISEHIECDGISNDDPLLANDGTYSLLSASPAIDVGTNMIWMAESLDVYGSTRIHGGTVDIGAVEFIE